MREIKFRAWDRKEKKLYTPFSLETALRDATRDYAEPWGYLPLNEDWEITQATGLKDKNGKEKPTTGVEIMQRDAVTGQFDKKVESFFDSYDEKAKKFVSKNGFPSPEGDTHEYSSDDWKIYFLQVKRFLVSYTRQHISTKFMNLPQGTHAATSIEANPDAIDRAFEEAGFGDMPAKP